MVQTTSPLVARQSYWCVDATLRACGFQTVPYHCYVPSFGEWGFIMACKQAVPTETKLPPGLKFFTDQVFVTEQSFSPDMSLVNVEVNKLNNQALVRLFEKEWGRYLP